MLKRIALLAIICLPLPAASEDVTDRYVAGNCPRTPAISTSKYPGFKNIQSNNKIAIPPGKSQLAEGQPVYFFARLFDANCVPVHNAKIEMWHADPYGKYRYATKAALATPDATFAGAGRTYSNNLGEFMFVTVYPGPYQWKVKRDDGSFYWVKRAPHFNVRITHPDFKNFDTNLFFEGDARNATDQKYKQLSGISQARVSMNMSPRGGDWNGGVQANVDIMLPGKSPWKRF